MIITIDTDKKIFKIENPVHVGDLIDRLKILAPNDWKEYTIVSSVASLITPGILGGVRTSGYHSISPNILFGNMDKYNFTVTTSGDGNSTTGITNGNR